MQDHPAALGVPAYDKSTALPFLFKVLSVAKALSIQVCDYLMNA